jgi:hypothetical protein
MCKSAAQGGQRCPSYAANRLSKSRSRYEAEPTVANYEQVLDAQVDWASTRPGMKQYRVALESEDLTDHERAAIERIVERGRDRREYSNRISRLGRAGKRATRGERAETKAAIAATLSIRARDQAITNTAYGLAMETCADPGTSQKAMKFAVSQYRNLHPNVEKPEDINKDDLDFLVTEYLSFELYDEPISSAGGHPYMAHPVTPEGRAFQERGGGIRAFGPSKPHLWARLPSSATEQTPY